MIYRAYARDDRVIDGHRVLLSFLSDHGFFDSSYSRRRHAVIRQYFFAARHHVYRVISNAAVFVRTNVRFESYRFACRRVLVVVSPFRYGKSFVSFQQAAYRTRGDIEGAVVDLRHSFDRKRRGYFCACAYKGHIIDKTVVDDGGIVVFGILGHIVFVELSGQNSRFGSRDAIVARNACRSVLSDDDKPVIHSDVRRFEIHVISERGEIDKNVFVLSSSRRDESALQTQD